MTGLLNWFNLQSALQWLNTRTGTGLSGTPSTAPVFLLSRDPVETLTQRVAGRHYIATEKLPDCFESTNTFAPQDRDAMPSRLELQDYRTLRVVWYPSVPETIYPASDTSAETAQGPVQSFAVWIGEFSATQNSSGYVTRNKIVIGERYAKGPILFITGTVGPKGSDADLELEDVENWRPGRPIYLPGSSLTLPFDLIRQVVSEPTPETDANLWFERWGSRGNIAMLGTNDLTQDSFSASAENAHYAFNGVVHDRALSVYKGAGDAPYDPCWRHLKPGTHFYTGDNRYRALDESFPDAKNFTLEIKVPVDAYMPDNSHGNWGFMIDSVRFDVHRLGTGHGYVVRDRDGTRTTSSVNVGPGDLVRYVVRDGTQCEISLNGELVASATISGEPLSLSAPISIGNEGNDSTSRTGENSRRVVEYLRIQNDEVDGEVVATPWVQVTFPRNVTGLSGLSLVAGTDQLARLPQSCVLQVSEDGEAFVDHETLSFATEAVQSISFATPVNARAVRLVMQGNQGDPHCFEIGNLELHYTLPSSVRLKQTGHHRNVALIGTNGLTPDSFTASTNSDRAYGAFNGWQDSRCVNAEAPEEYGTGGWSGFAEDIDHVNQWIQVDFGNPVDGLTGLSYRGHSWGRTWMSGPLEEHDGGHVPKEVTVQVSTDGINFTDVWAGIPQDDTFLRTPFEAPVTARYVRLYIHNYRYRYMTSRSQYVQLKSIEVYQSLPETPDPAPAE